MPNSYTNVVRGLADTFGKQFQSQRVITKTINTQFASNAFNPKSGTTFDVPRPREAKVIRSAGGNITGQTDDDVDAKATVTVMDMFTAVAEWDVIDEALKMGNLDDVLKPRVTKIITELEKDIAQRMLLAGGLLVGSPGTAVTKWSDVAAANTIMEDIGAPVDDVYYIMTPGTREKLADAQKGLYSGDDSLVNEAWKKSLVTRDFGGLTALSSNCLMSYTAGAASDRSGTVSGATVQTWAANKDAMTVSIAVTALSASTANAIRAGDIIQITGRNRINPHTGQPLIDSAGNAVKFTGVAQGAATSDGSGLVTITISGAPIFEGSYTKFNNIDSSITAGDVVTVLGAANTVYKPNLFYHRDAFTLATVKLPMLHSTDAYITTKDGFSIRVSKYANGDANTNKVRFDLLAAFGVINPHMAGRAHGV